jgi:rSAM/selenodomain-associated transferase 2
MLISIIVPTLNEAANLPVTLRSLAERTDVELIVVDGGSADDTVAVARQFTPYVFVTPPGRAGQMNCGARHATGDILLFLHADTFLLPGALEELQRRITGDGAVGGAFDLHIDSPRPALRWVATLTSRRARWTRLPAGNQAQFCWRQVFEELGGFPETPILEDLAFARQLRRVGRLTFLRTGLVTSARRWTANGVVKTTVVNWLIRGLARLRVPPARLRALADRWLVRGATTLDKPASPPPDRRRLHGWR